MKYRVVIKNLNDASQFIVLGKYDNEQIAESYRKNWRTILGNKYWAVNRRQGVDTLDHLALIVEKVQ